MNIMTPQIRVAAIGGTSSGKTYFLTDMLMSIEELGFKLENSLASKGLSPARFFSNRTKNVSKTLVRTCRKGDEFNGRYYSRDSRNTKFGITFMDVPGEIFTDENIDRFYDLLKVLYQSNDEMFKVETLTDGREEVKILRYNVEVPKEETTDYSTMNSEQIGRPGNEYEELGKVLRRYELKKFKKKTPLLACLKKQKEMLVGGKYVIEHFFEFDTDSVVEALTEAMPLLSQYADSDTMSRSRFINSGEREMMFYFFYCMNATDIVLCDKFALPPLPAGAVKKQETGSTYLDNTMRSLIHFFDIKEIRKDRHFFMAFRGADALMQDKLEPLFDIKLTCDDLYTFFTYILEAKIMGTEERMYRKPSDEGIREILGKRVTNFIRDRIEDFAAKGHSEPLIALADAYLRSDYQLQPYFNKDYNGVDTTATLLRNRLLDSVNDFMKLRGVVKERDDRHFLAPHVFLTSSAVLRNDFSVCVNDPKDVTALAGDAGYPEKRAYFGTLQLCKSLLSCHGIAFSDDDYAGLLDYYIND